MVTHCIFNSGLEWKIMNGLNCQKLKVKADGDALYFQ
jgi:hypothetical protein